MDYAQVYGRMHANDKYFQGFSIKDHVSAIANLVQRTGARTLLDYGCGKGRQYSQLKVHEQWGGIMPLLYDPGVAIYRRRPIGLFDGVICTDVMEHIEEADVQGVLEDIFSFVQERLDGRDSFVYFCIACRPAKRKKLPDGRNVHVTVKPSIWWEEQLRPFQRKHIIIGVSYDNKDE